MNLAKPVLTQLADNGHVVRGWLGRRHPAGDAGAGQEPEAGRHQRRARLERDRGSPAAKAGLKAGDVIVEFNGERVARADRLPNVVATTPVGREVPLSIVRDGKPMQLTAKVGSRPSPRRPRPKPEKAPAKLGLTVEPVTPRLARELKLRDKQGVIVRASRPTARPPRPASRRET